jgi:hypothetical protein
LSEGTAGAATWRIPIRAEGLAREAHLAAGQAPGKAIVEISEIVAPHQNTGQCSVDAEVVHVEAGEWLRRRDRVTFSAPCSYGGEDPVSKMMSQQASHAGATARVYLDHSDGELLYFEAL